MDGEVKEMTGPTLSLAESSFQFFRFDTLRPSFYILLRFCVFSYLTTGIAGGGLGCTSR